MNPSKPIKHAPGFPGWIALSSGVLGGVISLLMMRHGLLLSPDGWAYWEGSVSLLNGHGYTYFGGQPITAFPPAFSCFLVAVQSVLGISGGSLVAATCAVAGLTCAIWTFSFLRLAGESAANRLLAGLLGVFIACFVGVNFCVLLSEVMFLPVLGVVFYSICRYCVASDGGRLRWGIVLVIAMIAMLLTRNAGLALYPAVIAPMWIATRKPDWSRVGRFALLLVPPLVVWGIFRKTLDQGSAHVFNSANLFQGEHSIASNLRLAGTDMLYRWGWSAGNSLGWLLALGLFGVLLSGWRQARRESNQNSLLLVGWAVCILGSWLTLAFMCSITGVGDQMTGRFNWFAVVGFTGAVFALATHLKPVRLRQGSIVLLTLITLIQVARTGYYVIKHAGEDANVRFNQALVSTNAPITRAIPGKKAVSPPEYYWIDRNYSARQDKAH